MAIEKAAVLGATGGTGRWVARELAARGVAVRVVSRSRAHLERDFAGPRFERVEADLADAEGARRALAGCSHAVHCVGLPLARFAEHLRQAEAVTEALRAAGVRALLLTGYWSHSPLPERAISEKHVREGLGALSAIRKQQEDRFLAAGAGVVTLPDFYGPEASSSLLNDALDSLRRGERARWLGDPDAPREFVFLPDVARPIVDLLAAEGVGGEEWVLGGAGWIAPRRALEMGAARLGRPLRLRAVGPLAMRAAALVDAEARAFHAVYPLYRAPVFFDASKLRERVGAYPVTQYEEGVRRTLEWLAQRAERASA